MPKATASGPRHRTLDQRASSSGVRFPVPAESPTLPARDGQDPWEILASSTAADGILRRRDRLRQKAAYFNNESPITSADGSFSAVRQSPVCVPYVAGPRRHSDLATSPRTTPFANIGAVELEAVRDQPAYLRVSAPLSQLATRCRNGTRADFVTASWPPRYRSARPGLPAGQADGQRRGAAQSGAARQPGRRPYAGQCFASYQAQ